MNKRIRVFEKEESCYDILSMLMCSDLTKGTIHCKSEEMKDALCSYFERVGVPIIGKNNFDDSDTGYYVTCSDNKETKGKHIIINDEKGNIEHDDLEVITIDEISLSSDAEEINIDEVPIHLQNEEIKKMFVYAFQCAKSEIDIMSPWMSKQVVIKLKLADHMEEALKRGVKLKIIYGIGTDHQAFSSTRNVQSEDVAEYLRKRFEQYGSLFFIRRDNSHYKLCLCDELYKLEGGFNYLSFPANYDDENTWKEGSPFGRDVNEIRHLRSLYFGE